MTSALQQAFTPFKIGPLTLSNRFIKAATNEGMCKGGVISKGLMKFHANIAAGGAALTTVAYCATSPSGRTFVDQARLGADTQADFKALTDAVHQQNGAAMAQVTHAGCFTFLPRSEMPDRVISASGGFNKVGFLSRRFIKTAINRSQMDSLADEFVSAAKYARESGFDAIELHMGHGYLLSQFISPFYNRRHDAYGGTLEKRLRFPLEVLKKVLDAVGKDIAVMVKFSQTDGRTGGHTIADGVNIARALEASGAHMAVLSNGMNVESISAMFGSAMPKAVKSPPKNPVIRWAMAIQKMTEPQNIVFRELYSFELAQQIRSSVKMPLCYLGGVQSTDNIATLMDHGFEAIGMGRALIFDPDFIRHLQNGTQSRSGCTACNQCVTLMYSPGGTACLDPQGQAGHDPSLNLIAAAKS